jgi:membrane associated rhomboid family serine protease
VLTICLIAVNCLVFFLFQFNDDERFADAMNFYGTSGLEHMELSAYVDYLRAGSARGPLPEIDAMDGQTRMHFLARMLRDTAFQEKLERGTVITPNQASFSQWQALRGQYFEKLSGVVSWRYGFRPAQHRPDTFITYMFLHGGIGHLLGNMVVLWLVGCILEIGCGRLWYPAIYIPGGIASAGLFWLVYSGSTTPLVGASGAIAALMGAFAVLFGAKKIKIFYTVGFYFGYLRVYGFALLPFWLGNEFYQLFFGATSNVAYIAHIGGLAGGALLGLACLKTSGTQQAGELFREEASDEISPLIEQAMEKQGRLDLQGARRLLEQVLAKEPGHLRALQLLFTLELHQPENRQFHAAAGRLLEKLCSSQETVPQVCAVYRQYCAAARPQRLVLSLYLKLGLAHIEAGELDISERLLSALLRQKPETAGLPQALLRLADALRRKNAGDKSKRWLQALRATYPESPQARIAATALSERQEGRQS